MTGVLRIIVIASLPAGIALVLVAAPFVRPTHSAGDYAVIVSMAGVVLIWLGILLGPLARR